MQITHSQINDEALNFNPSIGLFLMNHLTLLYRCWQLSFQSNLSHGFDLIVSKNNTITIMRNCIFNDYPSFYF